MPAKRHRQRHAKPGQLLVYYGKMPHSDPDICYAWGGGGASRQDGNFLSYALGSKRVAPVYGQERIDNGGQHFIFENSVFEELEARGYDLTTLRFSIQKKTLPE